MLFGFPGYHAFTHRPTYRALKAEYGSDELAAKLAEPAVRAPLARNDARSAWSSLTTSSAPVAAAPRPDAIGGNPR